MPKLDQAFNKHIKMLENEVRMNVLAAIKDGTFHEWKERKIISVEEWHEIASVNQYRHKWLQHIPADFVELPFYYHPDDERELAAREKWYHDWFEYLEFKKRALYGKYLCRFCIINPSAKLATIGLRDLFLNVLAYYPEYKFPCTVVNRLECPYDLGGKVGLLKNLGSCWLILDEALGYAQILPSQHDFTIEADFEAGLADNYLYRSRKERPRYNLEEHLAEYKFLRISIRGNEDIYHILTDKEKLNLILEQYIEYLGEGGYSPHGVNGKSAEESVLLRKLKDFIILLLTDIKDKITLENLGDLFGQVTDSEDFSRGSSRQLVPIEASLGMSPDCDEIFVKSGSCLTCGKFANIHCVNCGTWVCTSHWKGHGIDTHNFKLKESI